MIRPLRRRHRLMIFGLAVIVPAAFATGLALRREIPVAPGASAGLTADGSSSVVWTRDDLWEKPSLRTRLLKTPGAPQPLAIELVIREPIVRPDVLVYWTPSPGKITEALPDGACLLGSFDQSAPTPLALPAQAVGQSGALILYSLAENEIVAASKTFSIK